MSALFLKIKNGLKGNPLTFLVRQVYRLIIILPFEIIVFFAEKITPVKKMSGIGTCFIISSVIYPKQKALTYAATRSVFSPETRAEQTMQTIKSIRAKAPAAKIILVEAGLQKELPGGVIEACDQYLYVGDRKMVRAACDSKFKSLGEVVLLLAAEKSIPAADRYFKISGRYFLNEDFSLAVWQSMAYGVHYIRPDFMSTRLYSFAGSERRSWHYALIKSLPYLFLDYPVEYTLAKFIPPSAITSIATIGVSGADATSGTAVKE